MSGLMEWMWVIILAMSPISELRGAIPFAFAYKLNLYFAIPVIIFANFLPAPFIIKLLEPIENWLRKWKFWNNLLNKIFSYTRKKTKKSIEKWESLALIIFVAIPLPVTGAWTGSLASYLFGLDFKKSLLCIFIGICIAGIIVISATLAGMKLIG